MKEILFWDPANKMGDLTEGSAPFFLSLVGEIPKKISESFPKALFLFLNPRKVVIHSSKFDSFLLRALGNYSVSPKLVHSPSNWYSALNRFQPSPKVKSPKYESIKQNPWNCSACLGTGASLATWETLSRCANCLVIASNSGVKDSGMMKSLRPQLVVAGDALLHFSNTAHARAFRAALYAYLIQNRDAVFVFPQEFSHLVAAFPQAVRDQFHTFPIRKFGFDSLLDIRNKGKIPRGRNVLTLLLLPLAAANSSKILLLGFDGYLGEKRTGMWESAPAASFRDEHSKLEFEHPGSASYFRDADISRQDLGKRSRRLVSRLRIRGWELLLMAPSAHVALRSVPLQKPVEGDSLCSFCETPADSNSYKL